MVCLLSKEQIDMHPFNLFFFFPEGKNICVEGRRKGDTCITLQKDNCVLHSFVFGFLHLTY